MAEIFLADLLFVRNRLTLILEEPVSQPLTAYDPLASTRARTLVLVVLFFTITRNLR